jgi:hypothetical protein
MRMVILWTLTITLEACRTSSKDYYIAPWTKHSEPQCLSSKSKYRHLFELGIWQFEPFFKKEGEQHHVGQHEHCVFELPQ